MKRIEIVAGQRFGKLTVLGEAQKLNGGRRLNVRCDCGTEKAVALRHLRGGKIFSCGCKKKELPHAKTHGLRNTSAFNIWVSMRQRCENPNNHAYNRYGGRGIKVCDRWQSFENFHADMGDKPKGLSLDRINNDGGYTPSNCRWATAKEQANNRRRPKD